MSIDTTDAVVPANMRRKDGTPLRPTCTVPIKPCCGGVYLLGDECDCGPAEGFELAPIFWDLRVSA